jgi:D-beta-D-heptose 7-phosphate kinase/D-beta-D-heptose 1-phosphate adenosyltransferase
MPLRNAKNKVFASHDALAEAAHAWQSAGDTVVFTNGCFDILHTGHLTYLEAARNMGDRLVIGLNTDRSVREIKGPERPIVPEDERALLIAGLECVDAVVLFDEPDPLALITAIKPNMLVKGADWDVEKIVGYKEVLSWGGTVQNIPLVEGRSTTNIIDKILKSR